MEGRFFGDRERIDRQVLWPESYFILHKSFISKIYVSFDLRFKAHVFNRVGGIELGFSNSLLPRNLTSAWKTSKDTFGVCVACEILEIHVPNRQVVFDTLDRR
ncbi:MAG: hypothetical protein RLZZ396_2111 [Planctomycetota bacterium]|jgi:hypothetical protein